MNKVNCQCDLLFLLNYAMLYPTQPSPENKIKASISLKKSAETYSSFLFTGPEIFESVVV